MLYNHNGRPTSRVVVKAFLRGRGGDVEKEARQSGAEARPRLRQDEPRHLKPIIIITTVLLPCKK